MNPLQANPPLTEPGPSETLLLFADISGYTRYIKQNPYAAVHALQNVRALLDAVLDQLEPEFTLAKLEGDAAFAHAPATALLMADALPRKLLAGFTAFDATKSRLIAANVCGCSACMALDRLDIKFILHQGPVLHFTVRNGTELGGLPVILLHRLSKNRVPASRYVLWTLPLSSRMQTLQPATRLQELHEEIGSTVVEVHALPSPAAAVVQASRFDRLRDLLRKELPWWWLWLKGIKGKAGAFAKEDPDQH